VSFTVIFISGRLYRRFFGDLSSLFSSSAA
jgi:hypothetical protein